MTVLYVRQQGAVVRREIEQIRVTYKDPETRKQQGLVEAPVREIEQIIVYGNVQITTQAVALLLEHEIDVVFLSEYGKFRGRLMGSGSKFARLRHAQLRLSGDDQRSLAVAKKIVQAKLANQRRTLLALVAQDAQSADKPRALVAPAQQPTLARSATGIDEMRRASSRATTADMLRGFEGKAGVYYFQAIHALLDQRWQFKGRNYHPPLDPFNALLSFGYALLRKDIDATLQVVGLDPYLGCFHALEYGRPSLSLDLMEEFRPLAVDGVMLKLALTGAIQPTQFTFTGTQERPVELGEALIPQVIKAYEARMSQTMFHSPSGQQNSLRRCLELQARIFARVVMGERQEYEGLINSQ